MEDESNNHNVDNVSLEDEEGSSTIVNQKGKKKHDKRPLPLGLTDRRNIRWTVSCENKVEPPQGEWIAPDNNNLVHPLEPIEYFTKYISDATIKLMVDMTNMYAVLQGDISFKNTNEKEIKMFIGLHLATGVIKLP